jgi:hypothetical protein
MNFQYSIDSAGDRHKQVQRSMLSNMDKMATSMQSSKASTFDFEKFNTILENFEEVNNRIVDAQSASENSFFNTTFGKVVHVTFDVGAIFVGLGGAGLALYAKFTDPANVDNTLLGTTLSGSAALIGKGVKDLWKNYNDYEATVLAKQDPIDPVKVTYIREIAQRIDKILHLTGPEAQAALEEYRKIYPSLPSRIKKILPDPDNLDAALIAKIHESVSQMLASQSDSVADGNGHPDEHRIDIAEDQSDNEE